MRRVLTPLLITLALLTTGFTPAYARAAWKRRIDGIIGSHSVSVAVAAGGQGLYTHAAMRRRRPASNQKLVLSMALLDELGPDRRLATVANAPSHRGGVIKGNLWIAGRGDPSLSRNGPYASSLPFGATRVGRLARRIRAAGITKITGRVLGSTGYFEHDWFARGWKHDFPANEVALPSALTFNGNVYHGRHISDPEYRAAAALTRRLIALGVPVSGAPGSGAPPAGLSKIADVHSKPLWILMRYMDRTSSNLFAEVLGKRLGRHRYGPPGTIAKAARAISDWAARHGVIVTSYDASGLSYDDRVSARGLVRLLDAARARPWGRTLRHLLATGGQGTLQHRLRGVPVRAKTGTLDRTSALSGWVWLQRTRQWSAFSILDAGMSKDRAAHIEDAIVRTLWRYAS
jgi:serine-type D-Ala-D-Ala carboxypeptidase/endopeptidase (penicillin-binding protein 4)